VAIFGAAALARGTPDQARAALDDALAAGVNHLDVAPRYGEAERLLGPILPAVRDQLFVGCKTTRRNPDGVRAQLEQSLTTLGCDGFDLYQLHGVTDLEERDARAGAARAILRAREEGLCRFAGITGHDLGAPVAHAEALRRYDLDTVMFPVNPRMWADPPYRRDAEALLELAQERDVGVMAIKAAAARPWPAAAGGGGRWATTWYEPYGDGDGEGVARGVRFALSVPGVHGFCTPGDLDLLRACLAAAQDFVPLDAAQREAASAQVAHEQMIFPMPTA
jgi:aryl-alcohol dehydrogenase-like predicted oxidoreductase